MSEKNKNMKESLEVKANQIRRMFEKENEYVAQVFDDAVIVHDFKADKYYEIQFEMNDDGTITKGERKEVDLVYIQKRFAKENAELTGPIFKKEDEQKIVYAAVLVPGEPDYDFDKGEKILSAEEIERVAHKWMEDYGNIDYMHGLNNVAKPIETFILPMDWEVTVGSEKVLLPKGTWILGAKVTNEQAWKEVKEGKLTGFSIMGIQNTVLKEIMKKVADGEQVNKEFQSSLKRVLIKDLGDDWIVPFVSLVDEPCVPKAKIFSIKQKEEKKENVWSKVVEYFKKTDDIEQMKETMKNLETMSQKAGRSISDATYNDLKKAIEALQKLIEKADKERRDKYAKNQKGDDEMNEEQVKNLVEKTLDEKLKPILEGIEGLKEKPEKTEKGETEEIEETDGVEETEEIEETDDEVEKLKEENSTLKSIIDKLNAAKKGKSKVEKGQEGDNDYQEYTVAKHYEELGRDNMGMPIKKGEK